MKQGRGSEAIEFVPIRQKKAFYNEARPRERSDRGRFVPLGKNLHTGVRTGCHYLISLSVCV